MGKSWKTRTHTSSSYPYSPVRVVNQQVLRPRLRQAGDDQLGIYASGHPVFSSGAPAYRNDMKHLEFVRASGQYYYTKMTNIYTTSCAFLPTSCRSGLQNIEDTVTNLGAPLFSGLQEGSERMLWTLDTKLESFVQLLQAKERSGQILTSEEKNVRNAHTRMIEESVQFLKEHGISGAARLAMSRLLHRNSQQTVSITKAEDETKEGKIIERSSVTKVLGNAEPSLRNVQRRYENAHTAIVGSQAYNNACEAAQEALQRLQDSALYRATAKHIYPAISGLTDPAIEKITNSAYTRAFVEHMRPIQKDMQSNVGGYACALS